MTPTRRRWERRDVAVGWEGRGDEPTHADVRLEEVITGKERNHRSRWYRNVRVGGCLWWRHSVAFMNG